MDIQLDSIMVMQDSLRHTAQVAKMIEFVKQGGFWTESVLKEYAALKQLSRACPVMEIIKFPDGKLMVHDGHHRIVAINLGGRDYLREDEYVYKLWSYDDYLEINFANRWVTPFDPRSHIRIPDIGDFKKLALDLSKTDKEAAIRFIEDNRMKYAMPRTVYTVNDLVDKYLTRTSETVVRLNSIDSECFRTEAV